MKKSVVTVALLLTACSGGGGGPETGITPDAGADNHPPVAVSDNAETRAGTSMLIDVLANDVDPDGDTLTLMTVQQPANGFAQVDTGITAAPGDDTILYTPNAGFSGQDTVAYTISDGSSGRASGLVTITVQTPADPVNTAKSDAGATTPNTPLDLFVLVNDLSDGAGPLAIASVTAPVNGTVTIEDNGTPETADDYLRYIPTPGFAGTDSFVYELATGQRAVVHILVNPDPGASVGATVNGTVTKDRVRHAIVRFYRIDADGERLGSAIAQTATNAAGEFTAILPVPRNNLLAVTFGGNFVDETDSRPNPSDRRVITLQPLEGLDSILPATADYLAINAFSDSLVRRAIRTANPGQFMARYNQLRNEFTTALGFDPVTTVPAAPDAPDPSLPVVSRQYAMALGGVATALNKIALQLGQSSMSYPIISGVIDDLSACLLDGDNEDGPVQVYLDATPVPLPDNVNLNLEILRFRNNKTAQYSSTPLLQINVQGCDGTPAPLPPDNDSPTALTLDIANVNENAPPGTLVGTFITTDIDPGDIHTYTLIAGAGDSGNGNFSISGNQLLTTAVFDFETQDSYSIRVRTDDGLSVPFERTFSITISDINETPTGLDIDSSSIDENLPAGTLIGTLAVNDDVGDGHTYSLIAGAGDTGNGQFNIVGDQLFSSIAFNFEVQNSYSVRIRADDMVNLPFEAVFTISVVDINEAPTANSLDNASIDENMAAGTVIGTFTTTDEDPADGHVYTLVPGAGSAGNGSFTITDNQLVSNVPFNFEAQSSYSIRVRTDDTVTTPFERTFTITVNDINEAPTANNLDVTTVDENLAAGAVIGTFTTIDDDPADSHTYTLVPGPGSNGNGSFNIIGDQLTSSVVFDYEAQSSYSIRVRTDDSVTTPFDRTFTITVNDINEAPQPLDDATLTPVDGPTTIDVLSNDSDPEGDPLTITAVTSPTPAGGLAAINDNSTPSDPSDDFIDYSPPAGFEGYDTFSYTVSDGLLSAAADITAQVSDFGYVDSISPANGAYLVPVTQSVLIVFDQAMNAATLDGSTLVLSRSAGGAPAVAATVSYNPATLQATIDPSADLAPDTVYFVVISDLIENTFGQPQGFVVLSSFSVTTDPSDTDSDGLSDAAETAMGGCLDPANADSDADGIGDGTEVAAGGDPCSDQGQAIWYVDDDGATVDWPGATTNIDSTGVYASGSPGNPNYVLIADGTYLDRIEEAISCDDLVYAGSQYPPMPGTIILNADGSPTTTVDMENTRKSELADCNEITLRNIELTGGIGADGNKGGGIRLSGTTTATLDAVWLTDNTTGDQGGGLGVSNDSVATVRNSVIRGNRVTGGKGGGGVWVGANATLDIADTLVIDNIAISDGGGGLYFDPRSTGFIYNTYLVGNTTSGNGSGIFVLNDASTTIEIEDSVISGNFATGNGGGIYLEGNNSGTPVINVQHNRITDNQSQSGGGIMLEQTGTMATVLNNLILGNSAAGGGGIYASDSAPELRNNTIIYNRVTMPSGAAVAVAGADNPLIRDSILWQNRAGGRPFSTAAILNDNYTPSVALSDFNLLDVDKIGPSDIDFVNDGVTPGFDSGFYLDQLTSPAVDSGSDTSFFLALDMRFTAAGGPADTATVDRGFHHPMLANYPADGYIETAGDTGNQITVTDASFGPNAEPLVIRPLAAGVPLGPGHYVVATLEGVNTGLAQLTDTAAVDPLSDGESVILSDLGNGDYRAFIASEAAAGSATTIALRIHVDEQSLPIVFNIDRIP